MKYGHGVICERVTPRPGVVAVGSDSSRLHPSWVALEGARCLVSRWKHRLCRGKWKAVCSFRGILRLWEAEEINRLQAVHFPDGDAEAQRVKMQTSDAPKSSPKPCLSPRRHGATPVPPSCSLFQFRHSWDQDRPEVSPSQTPSKQQRTSKNTIKLSKKKKNQMQIASTTN